MSETYLVKSNCTFQPPAPATPAKITMPVQKQGNPPTPVFTIVARQGSQSSYERETSDPAQRYADIYFNRDQFKALRDNVNKAGKSVYVTYSASADPGDDRITNQQVQVNS